MLPQLITVFFILSNVAYLEADERIVNGVVTTVSDISYQAAVRIDKKYMCGGSIITTEYILTAAHCTDGYKTENIQYAVGLDYYPQYNKYNKIIKLIQHGRFNSKTINNDISLLKIIPIIESDTIKVIPLAIETPTDGTSCIISGYGTMSSGGTISDKLRKANVLIVNWEKCLKAYKPVGGITSNMICAMGLFKNKPTDSCQGDSGGPLACNGTLAGIVSFGQGCGDVAYPGIYTNVANYNKWIINNMGFIAGK